MEAREGKGWGWKLVIRPGGIATSWRRRGEMATSEERRGGSGAGERWVLRWMSKMPQLQHVKSEVDRAD